MNDHKRGIVIILCTLFFIAYLHAQENSYTAKSLSLADIQTACDEAKSNGGGIVYLPEGEAIHSDMLRIPDGISLIGAGIDKTVIENAVFSINTSFYGFLDKFFRISGIYFKSDTYLEIRGCENFRIDNCRIEAVGGNAIGILLSYSGVIDHCDISATNYGVMISYGLTDRHPDDWVQGTKELLGSSKAIYIEDNTFNDYHHAIVGHANAHYVARHNIFNGGGESPSHAVDAHGAGYANNGDPNDLGTRLVECYNNTFYSAGNPYDWKAIAIRGGSGIIYGNVFNNWRHGVILTLETDADFYPSDTYPHDIWIWDNTHNDYAEWENDAFVSSMMNDHSPLLSENEIRLNQEYFLSAPSSDRDGFTYKPFQYPHPLVKGDTSIPSPPITSLGDNILKEKILVFPNPVTKTLYIHSNDIRRLILYSVSGSVILQSTVPQIDVEDIAHGVYFLKIETNDRKIITKKVVIE